MENIFFDITDISFQQMLFKLIVFLFVSGLIIYVTYLGLSKMLYRKSKQRKEIDFRLVFLWSLFVYFILFNVYFTFFIFIVGIDSFSNGKFFLGIIVQILIFVSLIAIFFVKRHSLKKIINEKSIN